MNLLVNIAWTVAILYVLRLVYIYVILFFVKFRFYSNQGIKLQAYWPILGYVFGRKVFDQTFNDDPYYYMRQVLKKDPSLEIFGTNHAGKPYLYLVDPDILKEFLVDKHMLYEKELDYLSNYVDIFGTTLLFGEGEKWKKQRRIAAEAFRFDRLKDMLPQMADCITFHMSQLSEQVKDNNGCLKNVAVLDFFTKITCSVVCTGFFGEDIQNLKYKGKQVANLSHFFAQLPMQPVTHPLWYFIGDTAWKLNLRARDRQINEAKKLVMEFGVHLISKRKESNDKTRKDLLQILLNESKAEGGENVYTDEEIQHLFMQLVFAGTDTSAHALSSCVYYLCTNPQYIKLLREEAKQKLREHDNVYSAECLNSMTILHAFIKECLRLIAPTPEIFLRRAIVDHTLGSYKIKKGTIVNIGIAVVGMKDPQLQDWDAFRPERWLGDESKKMHVFSNVGFSAGGRNCIGQHLATFEMKMALCEFLRRFTPELDPSYKFGIVFDFIQAPRMPMPITLRPYND